MLVVVCPEYGERLRASWPGRHVWVVASPVNEKTVRALWASHPAEDYRGELTLFDAPYPPSAERSLLDNLEMIELHHGSRATLEVIGTGLASDAVDALRALGFRHFTETPQGFIALRQQSDQHERSEVENLRYWIVASIRRILAGEKFTQADWEAQPSEGFLEIGPNKGIVRSDRHPTYFGWQALRWWAEDEDIRARDPTYAEMRKRELQKYLDGIEGPT